MKAKSIFSFASNPTIKNGGFIMVSKAIYNLIPQKYYPIRSLKGAKDSIRGN
jgi:hypothetical protein